MEKLDKRLQLGRLDAQSLVGQEAQTEILVKASCKRGCVLPSVVVDY
jgi:hypothetical protein